MLSIIVCSVSPEKLQHVTSNIQDTIGVEHEIIAIDNRVNKWSISKAYNEGARLANYPYLFFVHEDVMFHSQNWGIIIEAKLREPDCGTIGFTGTKAMLNSYSGWWQFDDWMCSFFYQGTSGGLTCLCACNVSLEHPFEEVVTLDGMGLFVRKDVWSEYLFDEVNLKAFHCYDIDFTLRIAAEKKYKNYVCCSTNVLIEHFSEGKMDQGWYSDTIKMYKAKWDKLLPIKVEGFAISEKERRCKTERCFNYFVRKMLNTDCPEKNMVLKEFLLSPFSWKHLGHCISVLYKYISTSNKSH